MSLNFRNTNRSNLGCKGEEAVANWLEKKKFRILARNYKKRYGEIDLIATKDELVVFVEVKTRSHTYFPLSDLIVKNKRRKIILTAQSFIAEHNYKNKTYRFDVALVENKQDTWNITYVPNAFSRESFDY